MFELTRKQKDNILNTLKSRVTVIKDLELVIDDDGYGEFSNIKYINKCYCKMNNGKINNGERCPYCGLYTYNTIVSKPMKKKIDTIKKENGRIKNSYRFSNSSTSYTSNKFWFVTKNPEDEFGLIIAWYSIVMNVVDTEEVVEENFKLEKIIYVNSGKPSKAYKISRGKEIEIDLFDAFNLNSKTVKNGVNICWDNANGFLDFILKNKDTFSRYGILECFNMVENEMSRNVFFMFYMYLYSEYPVVELLVKMQNYLLVSNIIQELSNGYNKEFIRQKAKDMNKLLNNETTKGNMALRIPKYISDYLNFKEANVNEFLNWCDFYELENISKEDFQELIHNNTFLKICTQRYSMGMEGLLSVMRYGYNSKKLLNYISKQGDEDSYSELLGLLGDYRNMMNIMETEAEEFPNKLVSAHNNALTAYRANEDKLNDQQLEEIADKVERIEFNSEEYFVKVPRKVVDFITEGNQQHNCVSSYVRAVLNKNCIVFFIRKKESPDDSFITAEFRYGTLHQLMYKNNVRVRDAELVKLATDYCNKIKNMHLI